MKTFVYIFILSSFSFLIFQTFFITKIIKTDSYKKYSESSSRFSGTYSLSQPFQLTLYYKYFENNRLNNLFFFSNFDISNFFFNVDSSFSLYNFLFNKYDFPTTLYFFRSNFVNYSLTHVNICRYYKFSESDFRNLTFSDDFSLVFGSFSIVHYPYISNKSFNYIYKYNFVFSLPDLSITLYINFFESDFGNIFIPVSFIKLSIKDYRFLISSFNASNFSIFDPCYIRSIFSKFFAAVFSTFLIPSRDFISFGPKNYPYLYIRNIIYSNIDSRYFKEQDTPIEYYTFFSSPKNATVRENVFSVRAFSFFKFK